MISRPLLPSLITAIALLLAANLFLAKWSHRLPYRAKLESIRTASDPNLLFVGNSLLDHHVDIPALRDVATQHGMQVLPLDAALGATEPPEHLLLFDYSSRCHPDIRTVVLGIFDFQLSKSDTTRPSDLAGNRVLGVDPVFSLAQVAAAYHFGPVLQAEFELLRILPLLAYRSNAWKYTELLRRRMDSMGMPHQATNSMGRVNDFAALEVGSTSSFDAQASAFLDHPGFNHSYQTMFDEARRNGMKVVIVVMPMSPFHLKRFYDRPEWSQYLAGIETLAHNDDIQIIDASRWTPDDSDFVDHVHMSPTGVRLFSARLGAMLSDEH